ncbi:hypothetical protein M2272_002195 [Mycobacterium frederiksbergense]|uniref:Uncharacterized protein n=1 Tax=Mycolicibacterium frederiksbergense TaxID=117567 RepID=A0ABT6KXX9_9MYCO|nr:hypothetical protein [Mycolicibacterium frederiksbergense]MDH6195555.1 hypothetical protein [Mycolicibacterium frederiksbergense]
MSRAVVHSDLLGHLVRADEWLEQGQSSYARAQEALSSADFTAAEEYGRITIQEAQEAYDLFGAWLIEIPRILTSHGVPPAVVHVGRSAAELADGWCTYLGLIDEFGQACQRREPDAAWRQLTRARNVWQEHHDAACDAICGLFDLASSTLGEAFIGDLWNTLLSEMYERSARVYHPDAMAWNQSMERLLLDIFEATRGHLTGPNRDGSFSIIEERDRWVITFAPCGSGGRTYESDSGAARFAVTTGEHDWAWNMTGVCLYCAHCCQLQQRAPIERLGFPLRVINPPIQGQSRPVCTWSIYKDRAAIPDEAYTSVGFAPPAC